MKRGILCFIAGGVLVPLAVAMINDTTLARADEDSKVVPAVPDEGDENGEEAEQTYLYELRTYTTADGKLDALHARFRDHTMALFEKHGMKNIIYWTPENKDNTLVYVIAHRDREAAKASWKAFVDDSDWKAVFSASRADGALVSKVESVFLKPTDYSPYQ